MDVDELIAYRIAPDLTVTEHKGNPFVQPTDGSTIVFAHSEEEALTMV